ncbi:hypothetical protein [uncultured Treponema sp.]|uniref:UGSC family (seleno)protein n=1 Tax=uncultured Treponema sp. TaxID=162155 RepID=UPI0025F276CC|nr:hypothetical protein [uncultured Treponema sp.]
MKKLISLCAALVVLFSMNSTTAFAATKYSTNSDECVDGVCFVPQYADDGSQNYAIVSPVGYHDVPMIKQAKRLDSLKGKTIALVGGSFMAVTTHNELKKCIEKEFPTCKIYMFDDIGQAGPYSVFGQTEKTKAFQDKLKELKVDAVIVGNCGCGLCTTKETGDSIAAEHIGIPSVTVAAPTFVAQVHSTGVNRGVPVLRTAEYPGAFASHSTEELKKNAREVLWPQIKTALTTQITKEEIALYAPEGKRPADEIIYYGNFDEIQEYMQINGWTDGLPVVPPTDEAVQEYLKFTGYKGSDILGTFALAYRECTVYTVAANAVMAGVPKEFMPICIAFVQGMNNGEWRKPLASPHGWTPFAWLNGPLARQLGIDNQQGMISEKANKALGRFIDLAMLNIGGYYVKENRMGSFGYLTPFTFSEDDEACVKLGWKLYHVQQGYDLNANTITAGAVLAWGNNVTPATDDPEKIMEIMAFDITEKQQNGLGNTKPQVPRTVFITEYVALDLAKEYKTKSDLEDALIETARRPLALRTYAHYWANTGSQQYKRRSFDEHFDMLSKDEAEQAKMTPTPEWLKPIVKDDEIMTIATMNKGDTAFLVTGDANRNKVQVMPGGGFVTTEIKLPKNWNELVAPLGYQPIENFYLKGTFNKDEGKKATSANKSKKQPTAEKNAKKPAKPITPKGK